MMGYFSGFAVRRMLQALCCAGLAGFAALLLVACGGGGGGSAGSASTATVVLGSYDKPSAADASRFLIQASYGPNAAEIDKLSQSSIATWLDTQFNTASMDKHWDYVARKGPPGCRACNSVYINAVMESYWLQAIQSPDQLRQRTAFALGQIFVVSTINSSVDIQPEAHAGYLDMLARNSFGNFRTLLEEVTRHPTMGKYLSHFRNTKGDPATGRIPDENYAREVMQLFSIGLWQLNPDGSRKKDALGKDIPSYDQQDVMGMARVMTGWSWAPLAGSSADWGSGENWNALMQNFAAYHESGEKRILGMGGVGSAKTVIAAGTSGPQSLGLAMDALFNHPNVGPFIGSQLIKRLVTSNPSPAYVARVTSAFNDNGRGVRGDMRNVLRAILLDPEARDNANISNPTWGKLREPVIRYANFMRAFDVKSPSGVYQIWNLEDPADALGQNPMRAPSVFNWYRPSYMPPGTLRKAGLTAPEFQIMHETTVTGYTNYIVSAAERDTVWSTSDPNRQVTSYSGELGLSNGLLLDRLNLLLMAGQMTNATRSMLAGVLTSMPGTDLASQRRRVTVTVALAMASPEFAIQK